MSVVIEAEKTVVAVVVAVVVAGIERFICAKTWPNAVTYSTCPQFQLEQLDEKRCAMAARLQKEVGERGIGGQIRVSDELGGGGVCASGATRWYRRLQRDGDWRADKRRYVGKYITYLGALYVPGACLGVGCTSLGLVTRKLGHLSCSTPNHCLRQLPLVTHLNITLCIIISDLAAEALRGNLICCQMSSWPIPIMYNYCHYYHSLLQVGMLALSRTWRLPLEPEIALRPTRPALSILRLRSSPNVADCPRIHP